VPWTNTDEKDYSKYKDEIYEKFDKLDEIDTDE
jgi:hypothetical protein